jgi:hypothetical protein
MSPGIRNALIVGCSDAAGFVLGALGGWAIGRELGFDAFAQAGTDARGLAGLVFILLGLGAGKLAAMKLRAPYLAPPKP